MNRVIRLVVLVGLFCVVTAYDYQDADFNEYLADELDDYYYSQVELPVQNIRVRRDEEATSLDKCKYRRKRLCCAENLMEELHEKEKDVKKECFKKLLGKDKEPRAKDPFRCENIEKHKKDMICVMQCVGQKNNVLDQNGDVVETAFTNFVKESFEKELWFEEFQDAVIETCINEAKNATENRDLEDKTACNPSGIKLAHCLFVQTQLSCPDSEIKDLKSCSKLRDRLKAKMTDGVPPPPPFLHEE